MGIDHECLHDLRVALRRTKAALRFFKPVLRDTTAMELGESISMVCDKLSIARDSQVWMEFLKEFEAESSVSGSGAWREYYNLQQSKNERCLEELRIFLQSEEFRKPFRQVSFFARVEVPRLERERGRRMADLRTFVARRLSKAWKKMPRIKKPFKEMNMEELHGLRRKCRRIRYAAEFAAPALGKKALTVERKLKDLADYLGTIHDMDVYLKMYMGSSLYVSPRLRGHLVTTRLKAMRKAVRAWNELNSEAFRRAVTSVCRPRDGVRVVSSRSPLPAGADISE